MNYHKLYDKLIAYARSEEYPKHEYLERHHIIPRCMGGSDDESNLVDLSVRHHFYAHRLLCRMYPKWVKLAIAIQFMSTRHKTSKVYAADRARYAEAMRQLHIGVPKTDEHKQNISRARHAMDKTKLKAAARKWISSQEFKSKQLLSYSIRRWRICLREHSINTITTAQELEQVDEKVRAKLLAALVDVKEKLITAEVLKQGAALEKVLDIIIQRTKDKR